VTNSSVVVGLKSAADEIEAPNRVTKTKKAATIKGLERFIHFSLIARCWLYMYRTFDQKVATFFVTSFFYHRSSFSGLTGESTLQSFLDPPISAKGGSASG